MLTPNLLIADIEIISLESDTESSSPLPGFHEVDKISRMDVDRLVERQDRSRLLIWIISRSPAGLRQDASSAFRIMSFQDMKTNVWRALTSLQSHSVKIRGLPPSISEACMQIASWVRIFGFLISLFLVFLKSCDRLRGATSAKIVLLLDAYPSV